MALTRVVRRTTTPPAFRPLFAPTSPELEDVEKGMRRMFGDFFATDFPTQPVGWMPAVEISETTDNILVTAELPGMAEKDVQVGFADDVLTLRGEKTEERKEDGDKKFHLYERTYGAFLRSFTFPRIVNSERVTAAFKNGILTVTLPKTAQAKAKGRQIPIGTK